MAEKLKDKFMIPESVNLLADILLELYSEFDKKYFIRKALFKGFIKLELKARMRHVTETLNEVLPKSYKKAVRILMKAAPQVKGFEAMCLPDYVELYGMEDWDLSFSAMALFTKYSSSEFAIRPYIIKNPKKTMNFMIKLAKDKDFKVRRFASEGCRPRLPWAMAIPGFKKDPSPIVPVLEILKDDEQVFVQKSVANNLNDISKDNPDLVLKICKAWQGQSPRADWIVKHACRTLLKAGDPRFMRLFGFGNPDKIQAQKLGFDKNKIKIGNPLGFNFEIEVQSKKSCRIRLEYAVVFAKANNKTSKKVFKITENLFTPGLHKKSRTHSFKNMSTRKHYPGKHRISIIINGVEKASEAFDLI